MAWPLIVICPRRRLPAQVAEIASVVRRAGLDRRLRVYTGEAAIGGMGSQL